MRDNQRVNMINGIFLALALNLTKPYNAKFALRLGGTDYHVAMISSLPAIAAALSLIPLSIWIEKAGDQQKRTAALMFTHKLFYLFMALLPFFHGVDQATIFVLCVGLMNLPFAASQLGHQNCIGSVFTPAERATAMGLRNRASDIARLFITLASGQLMLRIPKTNTDFIHLYQFFFLLAFLLGLGEVASFMKFKGVQAKASDQRHRGNPLKEAIRQLPLERDYLVYGGCALIFYFGWQMGWPLFSLYQIQNLGADEFWLSLFSVAFSVFSIMSVTFWAKLADERGNRFVIVITTFLMALTPAVFAMTKSLPMMAMVQIIPGTATSGTLLVLFNSLLEMTPEKNRPIFLAFFTTATYVSASIAPVLSVWIKNQSTIIVAMMMAAAVRMAGCLALYLRQKSDKGLPDPGKY
jgi:hypothetical protein